MIIYENDGRRGEIVFQFSPRLRRYNIQPGMALTDAKILLGSVRATLILFEPEADWKLLQELAIECQQFSPQVGIEPGTHPDSVLFDLTGCLHLHNGVRGFCRKLLKFLLKKELKGKLAVASRVGLAWAHAHYGVKRLQAYRVIADEDYQELPVESLRLPHKTVSQLHEFDLLTVGQILRLPRHTLKPRFGAELPLRLDQLLGHRNESVISEVLSEPIVVQEELEFPIDDRQLVELILKRRLEELLNILKQKQHGLLRVKIELWNCERCSTLVELSTFRHTLDFNLWNGLIELKLESLVLPQDVEQVQLTALETAPLRHRRVSLFEENSEREIREVESLISRLTVRLGAAAVCQIEVVEERQPEKSICYLPAISTSRRATESDVLTSSRRPLTLFPKPIAIRVNSVIPLGPPLRFWWREEEYLSQVAWGPERLETGWWREDPARRDYYCVETTTQQQFWLYRRRDQQDWFLHGRFD